MLRSVGVVGARRVIEIGTSDGYSTIWLADAVADTGGRVVGVDTATIDEAAENLERAGLVDRAELVRGDGGAYLAGLADESVDLLFLDAERTAYTGWWPHPVRVLRPAPGLAPDHRIAPGRPAGRTDGFFIQEGHFRLSARRNTKVIL